MKTTELVEFIEYWTDRLQQPGVPLAQLHEIVEAMRRLRARVEKRETVGTVEVLVIHELQTDPPQPYATLQTLRLPDGHREAVIRRNTYAGTWLNVEIDRSYGMQLSIDDNEPDALDRARRWAVDVLMGLRFADICQAQAYRSHVANRDNLDD